MDVRLYVCSGRYKCKDKSCSGKVPSKLTLVWACNDPENYIPLPCPSIHNEKIWPVLSMEISKKEIDKLFRLE
jgi:hypothetical protein